MLFLAVKWRIVCTFYPSQSHLVSNSSFRAPMQTPRIQQCPHEANLCKRISYRLASVPTSYESHWIGNIRATQHMSSMLSGEYNETSSRGLVRSLNAEMLRQQGSCGRLQLLLNSLGSTSGIRGNYSRECHSQSFLL